MAKEVQTHIEIATARERVWHVLTAFGEYSSWNPFIRQIDGEPVLGAKLTFVVATGPETTVTARARILELEENHRLVWGGGLPLGLFRGAHTFALVSTRHGTRLENSERFSGLLAAAMRDQRLQAQRQAFEAFNQALKRRAESVAAGHAVKEAEPS